MGFDTNVTGGQIMIRANDLRNGDQLKSVDFYRSIEAFCLTLTLSYFHVFCSVIINLLYVLNLLTLSGTTKQKSPNMGKKQAKSDQFSQSVVGYKWSREVVIFGKVTEKGQT